MIFRGDRPDHKNGDLNVAHTWHNWCSALQSWSDTRLTNIINTAICWSMMLLKGIMYTHHDTTWEGVRRWTTLCLSHLIQQTHLVIALFQPSSDSVYTGDLSAPTETPPTDLKARAKNHQSWGYRKIYFTQYPETGVGDSSLPAVIRWQVSVKWALWSSQAYLSLEKHVTYHVGSLPGKRTSNDRW